MRYGKLLGFSLLLVCLLGVGAFFLKPKFLPTQKRIIKESKHLVFTGERYSYFELDNAGNMVRDKQGRFVRREAAYQVKNSLPIHATALVIMDPWVDMATDHLNQYYGRIFDVKILPLVKMAIESGISVFVLTNDCAQIDYNCQVPSVLHSMASKGLVEIIYHKPEHDDDWFSELLRKRQIENLFYVGFASNMCVVGRSLGMVSMSQHGFRLYFLPEASAAVERADTWQSGELHKQATFMIGQWIGQIVRLNEVFDAIKNAK